MWPCIYKYFVYVLESDSNNYYLNLNYTSVGRVSYGGGGGNGKGGIFPPPPPQQHLFSPKE